MKTRKQRTLSTRKVIGIIALIAVIGFSFTACEDDDGSDGGGSPYLGQTPTLSGKVYVDKYDKVNFKINHEEYKGNHTVSADGLAEEGTITNGQLSFTLGIPENLGDLHDLFFYDDYDLTVSPNTAKGYSLNLYADRDLSKCNHELSGTKEEGKEIYEFVGYLYVDKDVTISGKGKTTTTDEDGFIITRITKDFSLALKAGWNTIYGKGTQESNKNKQPLTHTDTHTYSLSNPNHIRWLIGYLDD